jgi:hypothetical protein
MNNPTHTRQPQPFACKILTCSAGASLYSSCISAPVASEAGSGVACRYPRRPISATSASCLRYRALSLPRQRWVSGCRAYPCLPCVKIIHNPCNSRCSPNRCCRHNSSGSKSQMRMLSLKIKKRARGPLPGKSKTMLNLGAPQSSLLTPPSKFSRPCCPFGLPPRWGKAGLPPAGCSAAARSHRPSLTHPAPGGWSGQRDSNPRHQAWEACTLPAELCPLNFSFYKKVKAKSSSFPAP